MTLLILGLLLWTIGHLFKRLFPATRARMGEAGKGLAALASIAGIILMVIGYRGAEVMPVYTPLPGMGHLNNLLMLISLFFFGTGGMKGTLTAHYIRHNMLTGVLLWALAHLLVNGDLASIVLFGGMALYALLSMAMINRAHGWARPPRGEVFNDVKAAVGAVILYAVIAGVHLWLGYNPFLGTYG